MKGNGPILVRLSPSVEKSNLKKDVRRKQNKPVDYRVINMATKIYHCSKI
jgi:hypothetical protein